MKYLPLIAIVFSTAALAIVATSRNNTPNTTAPSTDTAELQQRLQDLENKYATLEQEHKRLLAQTPATSPDKGSPIIEQRVMDLAAKQEELEKLTREIDKMGVIKATEEEISRAYTTLLDENQEPWVRAKQAQLLKRYDQLDQNAVNAMRKLWTEVEDHNQKAAVLAALKGHVTPDFRDEIFATLSAEIESGNKSGRLRYHAIEALEPLLPDPNVQEWLTHLAENDPEPKIAARAGRPIGIEIEVQRGK